MGFEPTTFCMASRRSSQLSYSRTTSHESSFTTGIAPLDTSPANWSGMVVCPSLLPSAPPLTDGLSLRGLGSESGGRGHPPAAELALRANREVLHPGRHDVAHEPCRPVVCASVDHRSSRSPGLIPAQLPAVDY